MNIFGPVPSRRLGKSIGINNIPPKYCTYACVYCQLGKALKMSVKREEFFHPDDLYKQVEEKLQRTKEDGERVDYLTVVPDGEPTLDRNLGSLLQKLKKLNTKLAVITNASLLSDADVRDELSPADYVSVKVDSVDQSIWRKIDRPHPKLYLDDILDGVTAFSGQFSGKLVTETMLIRNLNDGPYSIQETANFISSLNPAEAYLGIPTRPPAEPWAVASEEVTINEAYQIYSEKIKHVEYLIGYEGNAFPFTGNLEEDILSITAVHPMREDAVMEYVQNAAGDFSSIEKLVESGQLIVSQYNNHRFYVRKLTLPQGK